MTELEIAGKVVKVALLGLLSAYAVVIGFKILVGQINTYGMLRDKQDGAISPTRIQLLLFTLLSALAFLSNLDFTNNRFPEVDADMLMLVGGSNALYLSAKSTTLASGIVRQFLQR